MACKYACDSTTESTRGGSLWSRAFKCACSCPSCLIYSSWRYKCGLHAFQAEQIHYGRFGAPEGKKGGEGERRKATAGEPALATSLWGVLYADNAGVVSQLLNQLRKMMGVIVIVCAAFGLTLSKANIEIICLRTKGMPEPIAIFSVGAAGQVYNQTNEFVYLAGNVNHSADLPIEVNRRVRNA